MRFLQIAALSTLLVFSASAKTRTPKQRHGKTPHGKPSKPRKGKTVKPQPN